MHIEELLAELNTNIKTLNETLKGAKVEVAAKAPKTPKAETVKVEEPKAEVKVAAPAVAEPVKVETPKVEAAPAVTLVDVQEAAKQYAVAVGKEKAIALVKSFGADKCSSLPPTKYAEALAGFQQALAAASEEV